MLLSRPVILKFKKMVGNSSSEKNTHTIKAFHKLTKRKDYYHLTKAKERKKVTSLLTLFSSERW